jgi:hypothetical protein
MSLWIVDDVRFVVDDKGTRKSVRDVGPKMDIGRLIPFWLIKLDIAMETGQLCCYVSGTEDEHSSEINIA